ncbi:acid protease [Lipomyces oligophaga]|uniref:acid protease n=1 Tax=Lipomyces oligophaga TaxID=45792 RepID=UPI0034CE5148
MKFLAALSYATLAGVAAAMATDPNSPGVRYHLRARDSASGTVVQELDNSIYLYYANITVGTPAQNLRLQIDTGSSDVWVQTGENEVCQESDDPCGVSGVFEPDESSSYTQVATTFSISYGDSSYARGDYAYETFGIGGVEVTNLTIGVATEGNATEGIMGIGYASNEAIVSQSSGSKEYNNLPVLLYKQGLTNSVSYSLWLNDLDSSTGSVLFGGVDSSKYSGELVTLSIDTYVGESEPSEFYVTLQSLAVTDTSGTEQSLGTVDQSVLLDSGTSFIYLPQTVVENVASSTQSEYSSELGYYINYCSIRDYNGTLDFVFDGVTIKVSFSELFFPATSTTGETLTFTNGQEVCLLTMLSSEDVGANILGDTFLRSAYVVFDLDSNTVSLAQTIFNATDSSVVAISSSIPSASSVSASATVHASGSKTGDLTGATQTGDSSSTALDSSSTSDSSSSTSASSTSTANLAFGGSVVAYESSIKAVFSIICAFALAGLGLF